MPSDAELLKAYLADRDVPCPGCGYSLKGCASDKCPECGQPIALMFGSEAVGNFDRWLLRVGTIVFGLTTIYSTGAAIQQCWEAWNATNGFVNWALFWESPVRAVLQSAMLVAIIWLAARSWHPRNSARREYHSRTARWFIALFTGFAAMHLAVVAAWMIFT